ncbi:NmrA family protein [Annulohypoxylon maeteangense]|uniref:NmrA family protein n=1 Tax=Annulohypoxylon maeteangense TaxID=1927788 RepID=UPI002008207C|nr:NmrA family protein [Annulohypoxylon maeteangense]KAI0884560.1 NmrA family protein [Annulohypoxylon maeteangense]
MTSSPTVFVLGATGNQGGAVARQLRALHWNVHALVRDLLSPGAIELAAAGGILTEGTWDNTDALKDGIAGCDKLFLNLVPCIEELDRERQQAVNIVNIAKAAGVTQIVSTTSLGVSMYGTDDRLQPGLLHTLLGVKKGVEQAVVDGGLESYTLLRPAYFMANFLQPNIDNYLDIVNDGVWKSALTADTQLGLVDHEDIAKVAVAAFRDPAQFNGREIGLASEFLTAQEAMDRLGDAMGRPIKAAFMTDEEIAVQEQASVPVKLEKSMRYMIEYVDMKGLEAITPLTSFKEFLEREKKNVKKL